MKSPPFTTWLLGIVCAVAATGCTDKEGVPPEPERISVRYTQTQCDDPWGAAHGEQALLTAAQAYLVQHNLPLHQLRATTGPAAAGFGCSTPTGLVLEGGASPQDVPLLLSIGFMK